MCLYVKKSFTNGHFKEGNLEFVFGLTRPIAKHLTGCETINPNVFLGVAQSATTVRIYGLERKCMDQLRMLLPTGFQPRSVNKVQAWTYRGSTVKGDDIGEHAAVGGFAVGSVHMRTWSDSINLDRFDVTEVIYGPGFVSFRIPELDAPDHGGRKAFFDPYTAVRALLTELRVTWSENKTSIIIDKRKDKA